MIREVVIALVLLGVVLGLYRPSSPKITYQFYHWKSTYHVERDEADPPKYIKVLDIAFNRGLVIHKTSFKTTPRTEMVPVVYLDNPLWFSVKAQTMVSKLLMLLEKMPLAYHEIQIDCDWTDATRESYFKFLKLLKAQSGKKLSATIRLHQVKYYTKTGVPPVDYGVLMYYNMSNFKDLETKNYILDLEIGRRYYHNFDSYPLALNLALPLYAQATLIRFEEVVGILEGVREANLTEKFKKIKEHHYEVVKEHYFQGRLLYKGDRIRIDEVHQTLLEESISELSKVMRTPQEILFYRWGSRALYGDAFLKHLVGGW